MKTYLLVVLTFLTIFSGFNAGAHKSNIGLLQIKELDSGTADLSTEKTNESNQTNDATFFDYTVNWAFTGVKMQAFPAPVLPSFCQQTSVKRLSKKDTGNSEKYTMRCTQNLLGHRFGFSGEADKLQQLVFSWRRNGVTVEKFFTANNMEPVISLLDFAKLEENPEVNKHNTDVGHNFFKLGIEHMLFGWDHVLFVISLLLLTGLTKSILITVTGFTIGHSVTLVLATSGAFILPAAPVEALIALSIVYMVAEAIRVRHGGYSYFKAHPLLVAGGFGLLHGLGFAGALSELAMDRQLSGFALLLFNIGIEVAQLLLVAGIAILARLAVPIKTLAAAWALPIANWRKVEPVFTLIIGSIGGYWFVERSLGFF